MKFFLKNLIVAGLASASISSLSAQDFRNNTTAITEPFVVSADSLILLGKISTIEELKASLLNPQDVTLTWPNKSKKVLTAPEVYKKAVQATVVVGSAYLCPHCSHTHVNSASGYLIGKDGVVVTNYHVVDGYFNMEEGNKPLALLVRLADGRTYAVKEILNASEQDDLAVLRLDVGKDKLPALSLSKGAVVGEDAYVLGHPRGMYYFFTKGIVNAKLRERKGGRQSPYFYDVMYISADYAAGSSGGPVLDTNGNIIGTVSSTRTLLYSDPGKSVQMVLKATIPVESLWKLIDKS